MVLGYPTVEEHPIVQFIYTTGNLPHTKLDCWIITYLFHLITYLGVSINGGTPKWMLYTDIREGPIKVDDLGVPPFEETFT